MLFTESPQPSKSLYILSLCAGTTHCSESQFSRLWNATTLLSSVRCIRMADNIAYHSSSCPFQYKMLTHGLAAPNTPDHFSHIPLQAIRLPYPSVSTPCMRFSLKIPPLRQDSPPPTAPF